VLSLAIDSWFLFRVTNDQGRQRRWTIGELLSWTIERFKQVGIEEARVDAEHLLAHALNRKRVDLYLEHDRLLAEHERGGFRSLVRRRLEREPVAYIEGVRGFHALDLELSVDRRVLVPRPETEHLVDWVLESLYELPETISPSEGPNEETETAADGDDELQAIPTEKQLRAKKIVRDGAKILDVGTGSGAIALALKHTAPQLEVVACDLSTDALEVARANAKRLGLEVEFVQSDLFEGMGASGPFDRIAANLPYIPSATIEELSPEVRDFEPRMALDGGEDGFELLRALIAQVANEQGLVAGGQLFLEIGIGQAEATRALLTEAGFSSVVGRRDLAGIERVVAGTWSGA